MTADSRRVRHIQWAIAAVLFILGGWCLIWPQGVIDLTFLPQYRAGGPMLPFFVFDIWFTAIDPVFTALGWIEAVGNVIMLALCVAGWRSA